MDTTLALTSEDVAILRDVIKHYLDELHSEIAHTDDFDFREGLHNKQRRLNAMLEQLGHNS